MCRAVAVAVILVAAACILGAAIAFLIWIDEVGDMDLIYTQHAEVGYGRLPKTVEIRQGVTTIPPGTERSTADVRNAR